MGSIIDKSVGLGAITSVSIGANVIPVTIGNGDDGTGTKGNLALSFDTAVAAAAIAIPGDIMEIWGDVDERNFIITGVKYIIHGSINYSDISGGAIIDDSATGQNGPIVAEIYLDGDIVNSSESLGTKKIFLLENFGSSLLIECNSIFMADPLDDFDITIDNGATVVVHGNYLGSTDILNGSSLEIRGNMSNGLSTESIYVGNGVGLSRLSVYGDMPVSSTVNLSSADFYCSGNVTSDSLTPNTPTISAFESSVKVDGYIGNSVAVMEFSEALRCNNVSGDNIVHALGGIYCDNGPAVLSYNSSVNVNLYKTIESKWDDPNGHAIVLDKDEINSVVLHSCTLICKSSTAKGISNDGNLENQISINRGANVSNRIIDPDIIQRVSNIIDNPDVVYSAPTNIVYVDIDPDEVISGAGITTFELDLDLDVVEDIQFYLDDSSANLALIIGAFGTHINSVVGVGAMLSNVASGVVINSTNVNFTSYGRAAFSSTFGFLTSGAFIGQTGFVGLKFDISGSTHYGWAEITIPNDVTSLTITRYAYNSVADEQILAGQTV